MSESQPDPEPNIIILRIPSHLIEWIEIDWAAAVKASHEEALARRAAGIAHPRIPGDDRAYTVVNLQANESKPAT